MHDASGIINDLLAPIRHQHLAMSTHRTLPRPAGLQFKIADQAHEFEAIHRLNYQTFVAEIPQHDPQSDERLVDRFHAENIYVIALHGPDLAGMVALRFHRPFSVEQKAPEVMASLPPDQQWCEIRLLAVEPNYRGTPVLAGLLRLVIATAQAHHCGAALISATTRQLKLYHHLGFRPIGGLVGRESAWYQPMWNTIARLHASVPFLADRGEAASVNLLPGPVAVPEYVRTAFHQPAVPHRGSRTLAMIQDIRVDLKSLTGASHVALFPGGGTLANDVIAGQLRQLGQPGLILVSGEFGRRLADHATRAGLAFSTITLAEGTGLGPEATTSLLAAHPDAGWLWLTHCETSTGVLHPLAEIAEVCAPHGVRLCVDVVSSLGVVPVDLHGVWLASGSSGKGLAAYPGVALVLANHRAAPASGTLPRVLDLALYQSDSGMPFTLGSNLIAALHAALSLTDWDAKLCRTVRHGTRLRALLEEAGFVISGLPAETSPAVLTLNLPSTIDAGGFARAAEKSGYLLAAHSDYLLARNQAQICLMGALRERDTRRLPQLLLSLLATG